MTDILERLERQWAALDPVDEYRADARDAITEIARLRAELDALKAQEPVAHAVLDIFQRVVHTDSRAGCHEHINDAINQFEIDEAAKWAVRPLYLTPQPAIPDGFVPVPKEPTHEMLAQIKFIDDITDAAMGARYRAMLAAAPKPGDAE